MDFLGLFIRQQPCQERFPGDTYPTTQRWFIKAMTPAEGMTLGLGMTEDAFRHALLPFCSCLCDKFPQTVLALRGSDGFSRDLWRQSGVSSRSSRARSYCKNAYLVTLTFAPLTRNTWSRAQIQKNSMVFVNFCPGPRHDRQAASDAADVCC